MTTMSILVSSRAPKPPGALGSQHLTADRLSDRLAARIAQQIDGGALKAGDRLPTEQQFATAYGVSRTVVREAVHQLKSQGLVRSRQGSGVFVTTPPAHRAMAFDPKVLESMDAVVQMVELRRVIEGEMAALAAVRATRAQIGELKRALAGHRCRDRQRAARRRGGPGLSPRDRRSHRQPAVSAPAQHPRSLSARRDDRDQGL